MATEDDGIAVDPKTLQLIVEEVDGARDTLQLVQQFMGALPIRSRDELLRAVGDQPIVLFRGGKFDLRAFIDMVPSVVFPVDSIEQLVTLAALAVDNIPGTAGYDLTDPETARRLMRRAALKSLAPTGRIGPRITTSAVGRSWGDSMGRETATAPQGSSQPNEERR